MLKILIIAICYYNLDKHKSQKVIIENKLSLTEFYNDYLVSLSLDKL